MLSASCNSWQLEYGAPPGGISAVYGLTEVVPSSNHAGENQRPSLGTIQTTAKLDFVLTEDDPCIS